MHNFLKIPETAFQRILTFSNFQDHYSLTCTSKQVSTHAIRNLSHNIFEDLRSFFSLTEEIPPHLWPLRPMQNLKELSQNIFKASDHILNNITPNKKNQIKNNFLQKNQSTDLYFFNQFHELLICNYKKKLELEDTIPLFDVDKMISIFLQKKELEKALELISLLDRTEKIDPLIKVAGTYKRLNQWSKCKEILSECLHIIDEEMIDFEDDIFYISDLLGSIYSTSLLYAELGDLSKAKKILDKTFQFLETVKFENSSNVFWIEQLLMTYFRLEELSEYDEYQIVDAENRELDFITKKIAKDEEWDDLESPDDLEFPLEMISLKMIEKYSSNTDFYLKIAHLNIDWFTKINHKKKALEWIDRSFNEIIKNITNQTLNHPITYLFKTLDNKILSKENKTIVSMIQKIKATIDQYLYTSMLIELIDSFVSKPSHHLLNDREKMDWINLGFKELYALPQDAERDHYLFRLITNHHDLLCQFFFLLDKEFQTKMEDRLFQL